MKISILLCLILIIYPLCPAGAAKTVDHGKTCEKGMEASTKVVYPCINNAYEIGADGHRIKLVNCKDATNPSYAELLAFIRADKTDEKVYDFESYLCSDYAETLHNNAEKAGYRCAWVGINFTGGEGHALNAFNTTDNGTVFIDSTGQYPKESGNWDKIVKVKVGKPYVPVALFRTGYTYCRTGIVEKIHTFW
jgi:hypothetical protein